MEKETSMSRPYTPIKRLADSEAYDVSEKREAKSQIMTILSVIIVRVRNWIKSSIWGEELSCEGCSKLLRKFSLHEQLERRRSVVKSQRLCRPCKGGPWRAVDKNQQRPFTWKHFPLSPRRRPVASSKNHRPFRVAFAWKIWLQWCYFRFFSAGRALQLEWSPKPRTRWKRNNSQHNSRSGKALDFGISN